MYNGIYKTCVSEISENKAKRKDINEILLL